VQDVDEEYFRNLERTRLRALVEADDQAAADLHAPDYELITPGAARLSKTEYLDGIQSGRLDYRVFEPASEMAVLLLGTGAAVRYQARIDIRFGDRSDAGLFWHTDIYAHRDGRWQVVWSQATRIARD
jgi:Domain of unknown function (DUF4440)